MPKWNLNWSMPSPRRSWSIAPELKEIHPTGAEYTLADAADGVAIPLHPGAAKYLTEKGVLRNRGDRDSGGENSKRQNCYPCLKEDIMHLLRFAFLSGRLRASHIHPPDKRSTREDANWLRFT